MNKEKEEKVYILHDIHWFIHPQKIYNDKSYDFQLSLLVIPFIYNKGQTRIKELPSGIISDIYNIEDIINRCYNCNINYRSLSQRTGYALSFCNNRELKGESVVYTTSQVLEVLTNSKFEKIVSSKEMPITESQITKLTKAISDAFYAKEMEEINLQKQREINSIISEETRDF